jgi:hypothetical protein
VRNRAPLGQRPADLWKTSSRVGYRPGSPMCPPPRRLCAAPFTHPGGYKVGAGVSTMREGQRGGHGDPADPGQGAPRPRRPPAPSLSLPPRRTPRLLECFGRLRWAGKWSRGTGTSDRAPQGEWTVLPVAWAQPESRASGGGGVRRGGQGRAGEGRGGQGRAGEGARPPSPRAGHCAPGPQQRNPCHSPLATRGRAPGRRLPVLVILVLSLAVPSLLAGRPPLHHPLRCLRTPLSSERQAGKSRRLFAFNPRLH